MKDLDKNFTELMKNQKVEKPSARFSINVMEKIYAINKQLVYEPVIGKWGWRVIFSLTGLLFGYLLFSGNSAGTDGKVAGWLGKLSSLLPASAQPDSMQSIPVSQVATEISGFFSDFPMILSVALVALAVLLFVDRIVMKRNQQMHI